MILSVVLVGAVVAAPVANVPDFREAAATAAIECADCVEEAPSQAASSSKRSRWPWAVAGALILGFGAYSVAGEIGDAIGDALTQPPKERGKARPR